jgi:sigma-B regulation protein RsbU (phosphoserine phosphatase)
LGIVLSIVIATPISKRVTDPIRELVEGTNHIASGELEYKVDVKGSDEIGELAKSFNKMASDLSKYIEELQRITMEKQRIESELRIASEIQTSMLPRIFPPFPEIKEFSIFATMDPAREVGGDLYDFFMIGKNKLCFIIGDASGKGVPAALFMAISKMLLKNEALRDIPPNEVLCRVNNILCPENETNMFITVLCMMLDINTGELEFSNGGHNPPLVCNGNGGFSFVDLPKGCAVGVMEDSVFESKKTILKSNDVIFLYTDGVTEAMNPENNQFSNERLRDCLVSLKDKNIEDIIHGVRQEVSVFTQGNIQSDDITMLAVKYNSHTGLSS